MALQAESKGVLCRERAAAEVELAGEDKAGGASEGLFPSSPGIAPPTPTPGLLPCEMLVRTMQSAFYLKAEGGGCLFRLDRRY